ncbi:MAG TPA: hypothetical protein VHC69_28940 [Polyangiaceae bacterium]|nr:hypothetical protein [Polyangiaceae bacterium]
MYGGVHRDVEPDDVVLEITHGLSVPRSDLRRPADHTADLYFHGVQQIERDAHLVMTKRRFTDASRRSVEQRVLRRIEECEE